MLQKRFNLVLKRTSLVLHHMLAQTLSRVTPLGIAASDGSQKGEQLAVWLDVVLSTWKNDPNGEAVHGPIWAIGTDGASAYRKAKHILCTAKELDPTSELGRMLHPLVGLNLETSKDGIIGTCDPRHVLKRE